MLTGITMLMTRTRALTGLIVLLGNTMHPVDRVVRALFLTLAISLLGHLILSGETSSNETRSGPAEVVKKYCQLDFGGVRLSGATWRQVAPLIAWEDEPGWDTAVVVSGFHISSSRQIGDRATVAVIYQVQGIVAGEGPFVAKRKPETVEFQLSRVQNGWKIAKPVIPPHVSVPSISKSVRELIEAERGDSDRRRNLEAVVNQLQALRK